VWSGHSCPLPLTLILILTLIRIRICLQAYRPSFLRFERARLQPRRHAHKPTTTCHSDWSRTLSEAEGDGAGRNLLFCRQHPWKSGASAPRNLWRREPGLSPLSQEEILEPGNDRGTYPSNNEGWGHPAVSHFSLEGADSTGRDYFPV